MFIQNSGRLKIGCNVNRIGYEMFRFVILPLSMQLAFNQPLVSVVTHQRFFAVSETRVRREWMDISSSAGPSGMRRLLREED
jgi:hypothetical protein